MNDRPFGADSVADRRYYHFVLVRSTTFDLSTYWRRLRRFGDLVGVRRIPGLDDPHLRVEHRKLRHDRGYARGITAIDLSENGNGRPPFFYDTFGANLNVRSENYVLLGFPFAALAREITGELLREGVLRDGDFQAVQVEHFLKEGNHSIRPFQGLTSKVVGVQFVVTDDKSLTAVRVGGDDPFRAEIYQKFLKEKFERKEHAWGAELCVLACEREIKRQRGKDPERQTLRSRVHVDKFGNFKFYVHLGCLNVSLMPHVIAQIRTMAPFKGAVGNPLSRLDENAS